MKSILLVLFAALAAAQTAVTFETAAIKPVSNASACQGSMIQPLPGSGLRAQCVPVRALITWAYQIQDYQLSGGPPWLTSISWDIMAKSDPKDLAETAKFEDLNEAQRTHLLDDIRQRLRALLADRFQLQLRTEMKEQTVYALTVGKGGPHMKEVEQSAMIRRGKSQIVSTGATMALLTTYLGIALGRPVTDQTGLTNYYAFELNWTPDSPDPTADSAAPSLVTAVQEQLGLRLQSAKAPIGSLVIERIEKASEN
jgi:bla regulator protein blaR1